MRPLICLAILLSLPACGSDDEASPPAPGNPGNVSDVSDVSGVSDISGQDTVGTTPGPDIPWSDPETLGPNIAECYPGKGDIGPDTTDDPAFYEPCAGLACGDYCLVCAPNDTECVEPLVKMACNLEGECLEDDGTLCEEDPAYDACADKACGDYCDPCDPEDLDCPEVDAPSACNAEGECITFNDGFIDVDCEPQPYDACADKTCGEPCSPCDPDDPNCAIPDAPSACDATGECLTFDDGVVAVDCPDSECIVVGCSAELCVPSDAPGIGTDCEWQAEYICLQFSACGAYGEAGSCGWQQTEAYLACMALSDEVLMGSCMFELAEACANHSDPNTCALEGMANCTEPQCYSTGDCDANSLCTVDLGACEACADCPMCEVCCGECVPAPAQPCQDLSCGDSCDPCQGADTDCQWSGLEMACNETGLCVDATKAMCMEITTAPSQMCALAGAMPNDPFQVDMASIDGDTLNLGISYSGGCGEHEFSACFEDPISGIAGFTAAVDLGHSAGGDSCEAMIFELVQVDLSPLKDSYQATYGASGTIAVSVETFPGGALSYSF